MVRWNMVYPRVRCTLVDTLPGFNPGRLTRNPFTCVLRTMVVAAELLSILVCPESKARLIYFAAGESGDDESSAFLFCPESRLRYRVEDGIPVMLIDAAERVDEAESKRLVDRARELGL